MTSLSPLASFLNTASVRVNSPAPSALSTLNKVAAAPAQANPVSLAPTAPAPAPAVPASTPVESPQAVQPTQFLKSIEGARTALLAKETSRQSLKLELTTQEGDTVELKIKVSSKTTVAAIAGDNGSAVAVSSRQRSSLSLEVEGDLNQAEQAAIADLWDQVQSLAEDFFEGDYEAALDAAGSLEFDNSQLADVALKLSSKVRFSGTLIQEGGAPPALPPPAPPAVEPPPAGAATGGTIGTVSDPVAVPPSTDPVDVAPTPVPTDAAAEPIVVQPPVTDPAPVAAPAADLSSFLKQVLAQLGPSKDESESSATRFRFQFDSRLTLLASAITLQKPAATAPAATGTAPGTTPNTTPISTTPALT